MCNSAVEKATFVNVKTTIEYISFVGSLDSEYEIAHPLYTDYTLLITLLVTDINGNGVPGKFPSDMIINYYNPGGVEVKGSINTYSSSAQESDDVGVMRVPVKFHCVNEDLEVSLTFIIDGITIESDQFLIISAGYTKADLDYSDLLPAWI